MAEIIEMVHYPEGTVRYILSCYSREDLNVVARRQNIREADKMKRLDLVECAASRILDEENAAEYWINLYEDERAIYERVMAGEEITIEIHEYDSCEYLTSAGYLFLLRSLKIEVPDEIRELYRRVNTEEYLRERERYQLLRDYIRAAVNLYERISADRLAEIINSQNAEPTSRGELVKTFQRMIRRTEAVEYQNCEFIDHYAENGKKKKDGENARYTGAYYVPEKESFLQYAKPGYVEDTPEYREFRSFLTLEAGVRELTAEMICDQLHLRVTGGAEMEELFRELDDQGVWFQDRKQLLKARELLAKLMLHTRKAANGGYTDWELEHSEKETTKDTGASNIVNLAERRPHK
ncbi:MAG: hypothetical protein J6B85_06820 [Lachnospiraceae bacterium]|nr:hypothetical protein [Lachnospiraceae bacterium]